MKVDEYQDLARALAVYPGKIIYPTLGLAGECGEFIEKYQCNGDNNLDVLKEAGDICWYMANLTYDCDSSLSKCLKTTIFELADAPICDTPTDLFVDLTTSVGKVAEVVKKMVRDYEGKLLPDKRLVVLSAIRNIYYDLTELVALRTGEPTLEKVAIRNITKLESRQKRNMLQGDGDDR